MNHKETKSKTNTGTTAVERSVEQTNRSGGGGGGGRRGRGGGEGARVFRWGGV